MLEERADDQGASDWYWLLCVAAKQGHKRMVKLLLDKDAAGDGQGGGYGDALQAASYKGHEQIITLLIDRGANVNAQCGRYGNAL